MFFKISWFFNIFFLKNHVLLLKSKIFKRWILCDSLMCCIYTHRRVLCTFISKIDFWKRFCWIFDFGWSHLCYISERIRFFRKHAKLIKILKNFPVIKSIHTCKNSIFHQKFNFWIGFFIFKNSEFRAWFNFVSYLRKFLMFLEHSAVGESKWQNFDQNFGFLIKILLFFITNAKSFAHIEEIGSAVKCTKWHGIVKFLPPYARK